MSWFDTIKYCKIPEREREPFHPRRDPNNPQRPRRPPGPYAEQKTLDDVWCEECGQWESLEENKKAHPLPDKPFRPDPPKRPDDWGPPIKKWGGQINSKQEALDAIEKYLRRYRMEMRGNSRHLGGTDFRMATNRLIKQLHMYIENMEHD